MSCFSVPAVVSSSKTVKSASGKDLPSCDKQDKTLSVLHKNMCHEAPFSLLLDISKMNRNIKHHRHVVQAVSSVSSANELPDAVLRLNTLHNVSPDSGIASMDESPLCNDSPDALVHSEGSSSDLHFSELCNSVNQRVRNKIETFSSASSCTGDNLLVDKHTSCQKLADELAICNPAGIQNNRLDKQKEIDAAQTVTQNSTRHSLLRKTVSSYDEDKNEKAENHLKEVGQALVNTNGSSIGITLPHKISKGGRPPKGKNGFLLKHKRSNLYSGLYGCKNACKPTDIAADNEFNRGSIHTDISGAKQTCVNSFVCEKSKTESAVSSNCNSLSGEKRSPGRPKGSLNKIKITGTIAHRTIQNRLKKLRSVTSCNAASNPSVINLNKMSQGRFKRPRGRPRKNPLPDNTLFSGNKDVSVLKTLSNTKPIVTGKVQIKYTKKSLLIQRKRKARIMIHSACRPSKLNKAVDKSTHSDVTAFYCKKSENKNCASASSKIKKSVDLHKVTSQSSDQIVHYDHDFDAKLKNVKSSVSSNEEKRNIPSVFSHPFKHGHLTYFSKKVRPRSPNIVKPKAKKPKLHVMMRRTKRKKKRKIENGKSGTSTLPPKKSNVPVSMLPENGMDKFISSQRKVDVDVFGSSVSDKSLYFFNSLVQPSKILTLSRLNIFHSDISVDGPHRSSSSTDIDQSEWVDKRAKKRHRLLYRKSKHKNIVDPVFASDLDSLISGLNSMAICENPADNYIRVRPGEVPLPSIFKVIKIDVNKKLKDRVFTSEICGVDKVRQNKVKKDTPSPYEISPAMKIDNKVGRRKSSQDQPCDQQDNFFLSDTNEQCLPPKKRHRLVNIETSLPFPPLLNSVDEAALSKKDLKPSAWNRKGKQPRKVPGLDESSQAQGRLEQLYLGQELTIDTSSFTTGESSFCTPSLSPCPSRLSTRSSTVHSLSSPSLTESLVCRDRYHLKYNFSPACPIHCTSSCLGERLSCSECCFQEHSLTPSTFRSDQTPLKSLSVHASESCCSSEQLISSSEPSPISKEVSRLDRLQGKTTRGHRQSSNLFVNDSDSSLPWLEVNSTLSPNAYHRSISSEQPEISHAPFRRCMSPRRQSSTSRISNETVELLTSPSLPPKIMCSDTSPQTKAVQPSQTKSFHLTSGRKLCNKSNSSQQSSCVSMIHSSGHNYEPLPLEHCSKRKLVEEIQAAMASDSDEDTPRGNEFKIDSDHSVQPSTDSNNAATGQPPRKRFQKFGLFSDFYKDEEPKKRCENLLRCRDKLAYVREEHEFGLMPQPLHIGQYYMRLVQDFQLPYDIWWQHVHHQLPKKSEPKIKFRTIRTNVYSDSRVSNRKLEVPHCNCTPQQSGGKGCGDDCLNRMIYTECLPMTCPVGENCGNQKIQKHEWAQGLEKFLTKDRGFGVRTRSFIKNGQFILEYLGEVISETEFRRRMMEEYSEERHHYALHLDSGSLIDGYRMGNIGRYVNHSCLPNCEMQKWNVNGLYRMVLFALRDIEPDEELTYDYNFDPFNQENQQECHCGSSQCRGLIGVKTHRSNGTCKLPDKSIDDSKDKCKSKLLNMKIKDKPSDLSTKQPLPKPMSFKERCFVRRHRTFLVRNVDRVRNQRGPVQDYAAIAKEEANAQESNNLNSITSDQLLAHSHERSVKTRLAAYSKDNPEIVRRHHLSQIFDSILTELMSLKDEDDYNLVGPLMSLPLPKKQPEYYQVVKQPIDLSMIKERVKTGFYDHLSSFNSDIMLLFSNVELYCGPKSEMGQIILKLRQALNNVKTDMSNQIDELLGPNTTKTFMDPQLEKLEQFPCKRGHNEPEEDIIRCICGVTRDEGLMLQCEKCFRWQHCDCVRASGNEEHYLCDRCEPRYYDPEIVLIPQPLDALPKCTYYLTIVKDDVQYAAGDCVYVMRDTKRTAAGTPLRASHRLMAAISPDKLDIFRLEQLWKDSKGEKFASGTPYFRPQETFHEPTRKFYQNELFRTPHYEIVPMELVVGKCVVMDPGTYIKGRPKGFKEQDIYICEYRVDKTAHLFHKIQKIRFPINTGTFCFDWFDTKLNIKRTYLPHEVPEEYMRKAERSIAAVPSCKQENLVTKLKSLLSKAPSSQNLAKMVKVDDSIKNDLKLKAEVKVHISKGDVHKKNADSSYSCEEIQLQILKDNKRKEKEQRLDKILTRLLSNLPWKQKVDLTYLLDRGKRVRKKVTQ